MKRVFLLLLVLCLCTVTVFASEDPLYVFDNEGLLSAREEEKLSEKLSEIHSRQDIYVAVWTDESPAGYSKAFFDGDQENYIILLVCAQTRDWEVYTGGEGDDIVTDSRLQEMVDEFKPLLSEGDYFDAFTVFAEECNKAIDIYRNGEPFAFWAYLLVSLVLGLVVALIVTGVMRSKLKSVKSQRAAANYVRPDSMQLTQSADLYLYSHVSRIKKPENNNNNRSFSTTSRGGRGGKF